MSLCSLDRVLGCLSVCHLSDCGSFFFRFLSGIIVCYMLIGVWICHSIPESEVCLFSLSVILLNFQSPLCPVVSSGL